MLSKNEQYLNKQISSYLDGEMTQSERAEFERELADSAELAARLAEYKEMLEMLAELPEPELPEGLHQQIMSNVRTESVPQFKAKTGVKLTYVTRVCTFAASIFLAVFIIGGAAWLYDNGDSSTASSTVARQAMMLDSAAEEAYDMELRGSITDDSGAEFYNVDESITAEPETVGGDIIYSGEAGTRNNADEKATTDNLVPSDEASVASASSEQGISEEYAEAEETQRTYVNSMDIKEYYISVEVEDVEQAVAAIAELDGYDKYTYIDYGENYSSASIDRAVNSESSEEVLAYIGALGDITSQSQQQSSLVDDYNDALAGFEAKQEEYQHLLEILELTSSYDEVTSVMGYLDNCVAAMEDYQSTMQQIESEPTTPVIHITLEQSGGTVDTASLGERAAAAFQGSVDGVVYALQSLVLIGAWLIAPLTVLAVIVAVVLVIRRRRKKGGSRHE